MRMLSLLRQRKATAPAEAASIDDAIGAVAPLAADIASDHAAAGA